MAKLTRREAIERALLTRGEHRVDDSSLSRWVKYSRQYRGRRNEHGNLDRTDEVGFWFVSRDMGALRVGRTSTAAMAAHPTIITELLTEGGYTKLAAAKMNELDQLKWFPFSAEELLKLRAENRALNLWAIDCRDQVLYPASHFDTDIGRAAEGLGQFLLGLLDGNSTLKEKKHD